MNKWYGPVGYATMVESAPDVWIEQITERMTSGNIQQLSRRLQDSGGVNSNVVITNALSILADPYAIQHFQDIRYAEVWGTKWKVTNIEVNYPRLLLHLGEQYHEEPT